MVREVIRKKLYDAATQGDATTFQQLLQEDPYLLDVVSFPDSRNLLHIATRSGQAAIVEEILRINQHLAWSLDSQKSSSLHIAAAKGTVEIASKLLAIAPQTCWLRDCHGMNPVHIAAMNGHVEILEEFIRHDRLPATEKIDHRQTVLHLCVKHGQLRVLQVLVNHFRELVHLQDDYGETVLHLAVRYKQVEIVRYLVENTGVEYQCSRNSNRETALDISLQSPQDTIQSEITKILENITTIKFSNTCLNKVPIEVVLGILALIAGMTFQAAINPRGGVWQDDSATHKAGTPILASTDPEKYKEFVDAKGMFDIGQYIVLAYLSIVMSQFGILIHFADGPMSDREHPRESDILFLLLQEIMRQHVVQLALVIAYFVRTNSRKRKRGLGTKKYEIIGRIPDQEKHLNRLISNNDIDCIANLRMDRNTFGRLCRILRELGGLVDGRFVTVEEQVAMFLSVLAHHKKNRIVRFDFWRSGQTISYYVHAVLGAILKIHGIFLSKPEPVNDDSTDPRWRWFKGCLGALDGTYINVMVSNNDKARYRTRKGQISTNVLGVCDRNLRFVYILSGWEGSAADSRILRDAINRPHGLKVPKGNTTTITTYSLNLNLVHIYIAISSNEA
ncbi:uncharacterized protein LOC130994506 [Salvia miltiorrhiza]|uniref:uncharacterized protein LOC130994506 n=1 Tax=Salvia miltiorrhiza TaxID=226208 RepID=UPI0025AC46F0|nr:uncharacterized protein LOC130994506 [Salvia miltiorrhiza]